MNPVSTIDPAREALTARLRALLQDALAASASCSSLSLPLALQLHDRRAAVDLSLSWKAHPRLAVPDDVERAVLHLLLARGGTRYTDLLDALIREDVASIRTLERRLYRLCRLGLVTRTDEPRGFSLSFDPSGIAGKEAA